MKKKTPILVTGAAGFVGLHTAKALVEEGYMVREFAGDVRSVADWKANLAGGEVVVHLTGVRTETKADITVNTRGTQNLFLASQATGRLAEKVVLASSQAVYMGCRSPFTERMALKPTTIYGKSKLEAEKLALVEGRRLGIPVVILRYSTVLGAGIRQGSSMSGPLAQWTRAGLSGEPIRVNQDGKQTRDYVHVDDVVVANLLAIARIPSGIFNVGGGKRVPLMTLAQWVKRATGERSTIEIVGGGASSSDPKEMFSNINKLRKLGWRPVRTAKAAVEEYVRERLASSV